MYILYPEINPPYYTEKDEVEEITESKFKVGDRVHFKALYKDREFDAVVTEVADEHEDSHDYWIKTKWGQVEFANDCELTLITT